MYIDYLSNSRTNGMNTGREYLTMEELAAIIKREFDSLSRHQELAAIQHHYGKGRYTLVINPPTDAQQFVANPPIGKRLSNHRQVQRQWNRESFARSEHPKGQRLLERDSLTVRFRPESKFPVRPFHLCRDDWHSQQSLPRDHFQTVRLPGLHHPFLPCLRQANQQRNA